MSSNPTLWEKIKKRFLNSPAGVLVLAVLAVGGVLTQSLGVWDQVLSHYVSHTPDLKITPLSSPQALVPFPGYSVMSATLETNQTSGPQAVYPQGVTVRIDVAHDLEGDATIEIDRLEINVDQFTPGMQTALAYKAAGDQISGHGPSQPGIFQAVLFGTKVQTGRADAAGKVTPSRSDDFFDTPDHLSYKVSKADDTMAFIVDVSAEDAGLYRISFTITYSVLGQVKQQHTSPSVFIYSQGG